MGGTDDPSNLIELTLEEHAEAHRLLWEQYGKWEDKYAWLGLLGMIPNKELHQKISSEAAKSWWKNLSEEEREKRIGAFNSTKIGNKHALGKTWTLSEETKKKVSKAKKGVRKTDEVRKKESESRKGSGNPMFGRKHSPETKEKIRLAALQRKLG